MKSMLKCSLNWNASYKIRTALHSTYLQTPMLLKENSFHFETKPVA